MHHVNYSTSVFEVTSVIPHITITTGGITLRFQIIGIPNSIEPILRVYQSSNETVRIVHVVS